MFLETSAIFVYSFLVALLLPTPGEFIFVFLPMLSPFIIVIVGTLGKTLGSYTAFFATRKFIKSNFFEEKLGDLYPFNKLKNWVEGGTESLLKKYGYLGLLFLLSVPGLPDTISVYAFSIVEYNEVRFITVAFIGSFIRLSATYMGIKSILSLLGI